MIKITKKFAFRFSLATVAWIILFLFFQIFSMYGFSPSIRLPFGWTPDNFGTPLCASIENRRYHGEKLVVEPGFPFKSSKQLDTALDTITISDLCSNFGNEPKLDYTVSKNRAAFALNIVTLTFPILFTFILWSTVLLKRRKNI